jgi:hypothetical protein
MLEVLVSLEVDVPSPATFSERKALLLGQVILAVPSGCFALKQLCSQVQATKQHLDSKKLEVVDFARAKGTKLAGAYGRDHIHTSTFYGFRVHARVDDRGSLCHLLLRPANEHDISVAPRLLKNMSYTIVTGDKGYISRDLKTTVAYHAVDLVTPRRRDQLPQPSREKMLYQGHKIIESIFSSFDRLGLSDRPYRSNIGLVLHIYTTILAYQLLRLAALRFMSLLFRIGV